MSSADFQSNDSSPITESLADTFLQRVLSANPQADLHADLGATVGTGSRSTKTAPAPLAQFIAGKSVSDSLEAWFGDGWRDDPRLQEKQSVLSRLAADIAEIDRLLTDQINAILHHPRFQRLESSWRGLAFMVRRADLESDPMIKVRVLSARWKELEKDFERSVEFDQSSVFKKVYE